MYNGTVHSIMGLAPFSCGVPFQIGFSEIFW
ncbi:hypothetical protein AX774_g5883, partial [Zancudomyces culisetae]